MQHEEPRIVNLTLLRREEEESSTVTFDYVEIVLILLLLLITIAKRVFFRNTINRQAADVTDYQETTDKKTSSELAAVETSQ